MECRDGILFQNLEQMPSISRSLTLEIERSLGQAAVREEKCWKSATSEKLRIFPSSAGHYWIYTSWKKSRKTDTCERLCCHVSGCRPLHHELPGEEKFKTWMNAYIVIPVGWYSGAKVQLVARLYTCFQLTLKETTFARYDSQRINSQNTSTV